MSSPIVYSLKHPLTFTLHGPDGARDETRSELVLRRLKAKDMRGMPTQASDAALHLIAKSSGLTAMQVDELDLEDVTALGEVIEGFMPPGLPIGATFSAT